MAIFCVLQLTPEEQAKRVQRKERNRVAAQRCRKRRSDLADSLEDETRQLEKKNKSLHDDISSLEREKRQLEQMLLAHDKKASRKGSCNVRLSTSSVEDSDDVMSGDF